VPAGFSAVSGGARSLRLSSSEWTCTKWEDAA
jgi:hypothetical protein